MYFSLYETSRDQLKVSLPTVHRLIRAGALDVVKIGRRTFITKESVERLVAGGDPRREEIADLRERLAYAYEQIRELSAKVPRGELHST